MALKHVLKRDGSREPYREEKIAQAIFCAGKEAGEDADETRMLATHVAEAVTVFLANRHKNSPDIAHHAVSAMVENVLTALGKARIARAFAAFDAKTAEPAAPLSDSAERDESPPPLDAAKIDVESETHASSAPWDSARITRALVTEASLSAEVARHVAAIVEQKVCSLGLSRVRTSLVRELVDGVLFHMGFRREREAQRVIGIPKYDFEQLLLAQRAGAASDGREQSVFRCIARQYALAEVYSDAVARAHLRGDLHIHGLDAVDRFHSARLSPDALFAHGNDGFVAPRTSDMPGVVCEAVRRFRDRVHHDVRVLALNYALAPAILRSGEAAFRGEADALLERLARDAPASAPKVTIEVAATLPDWLASARVHGLDGAPTGDCYADMHDAAHAVAMALVDAFRAHADLAPLLPAVEVRVDPAVMNRGATAELLDRCCALSAECGLPAFRFDRRTGARFAAPAGSGNLFSTEVPGPPRVVVQKVSINLPRILLEARGDQNAAFEELARVVTQARDAHREFRRFMRSRLDGEPDAPWSTALLDAAPVAIGLEGLAEAIHLFSGASPMDSDSALRQGYALLSEGFFQVFSGAADERVILEDDTHPEALARFRLMDGERYGASLRSVAGGVSYSPGVRLPDRPAKGFLERVRREGRFRSFLQEPGVSRAPYPRDGYRAAEIASLVRAAAGMAEAHAVAFPAYVTRCARCATPAPGPRRSCPHCRSTDVRGLGNGSGWYREEPFPASVGGPGPGDLFDSVRVDVLPG